MGLHACWRDAEALAGEMGGSVIGEFLNDNLCLGVVEIVIDHVK